MHIPLSHLVLAPQGLGRQGSFTTKGVAEIVFWYSEKFFFLNFHLTFEWFWLTETEGIASVTFSTGAYWYVIKHITYCAYTARARAGIFTFLSYTS